MPRETKAGMCFTVLGMYFFDFSFLVLFIFTGGLQKAKFFATIPRAEMFGVERRLPREARGRPPRNFCLPPSAAQRRTRPHAAAGPGLAVGLGVGAPGPQAAEVAGLNIHA